MNLEEFDFKEQYQTFHNFGYAKAPDGSDKVVGNKWLHEKFGGRTIFDTRQADYAKEQSLKREHSGKGSSLLPISSYTASDVENWKGPWAGYQGEEEDHMTSEEKGEMTEWQRVWLERNKDKKVREVFFLERFHVVDSHRENA